MGVGSLMTQFAVWGFVAFLFLTFALPITLIVKAVRTSYRRNRVWEVTEYTGSVFFPDDIGHAYSLIRAWDRHLISIGLPTVGVADAQMLEFWKVSGPDAEVWWIDDNGRADTRPYKTLLQTELRKASDSPRGRSSDTL